MSWAAPGATGKWPSPDECCGSIDATTSKGLHPAALRSLADLAPVTYPGVDADGIDFGYQPCLPVEQMTQSLVSAESVEPDGWTGFEADTARRVGSFVNACEQKVASSCLHVMHHHRNNVHMHSPNACLPVCGRFLCDVVQVPTTGDRVERQGWKIGSGGATGSSRPNQTRTCTSAAGMGC